MPQIGRWKRSDGISGKDVDEVAGWAHKDLEASVYLARFDNGKYYVQINDANAVLTENGERSERIADGINTQDEGMVVARNVLRDRDIMEVEMTRDMKNDIYQRFAGKLADELRSISIPSLVAHTVNQNYDLYARYETGDPDGEGQMIEEESVKATTDQHDHKVVVFHPVYRGTIVSDDMFDEGNDVMDYYGPDLMDVMLEEKELLTNEMYRKVKRDELYSDVDLPNIVDEAVDELGKFLARKFKEKYQDPERLQFVGNIDQDYMFM